MSDVESVAGCFGEYGAPRPPNGPCFSCSCRDLCKHTTEFYVSKNKLRKQLLGKVDEILTECKQDSASQYDKKNEKEVRR
jgi:hypothetical protein